MGKSYHEPDLSLIWRRYNCGEDLESLACIVPAAIILVLAMAARIGRHNLKPRLITSSRRMYASRVSAPVSSGPSQ
jgi:hypothetical protein